ncbi:MAG: FG-GAP-like repeat-containing protein, partial [Gammaproteobacteria bacterium]
MKRVLSLLALAAFCSACSRGPDLSAADIARNNQGVALMGQYKYAEAHDVFAALATSHPDWTAARLNLAIATLNRQNEGDIDAALGIVREVLARHADNLRAHYLLGLLLLYQGEVKAARPHFLKVAQGDPSDAYAAYYLGQIEAQLGEAEEAVKWYRHSIADDAYLRSAYYGAALMLRRQHKVDEARRMLADYQRFADNPRSHLAEFKYTRMGPRAEAVTVDLARPEAVHRPGGALFREATTLAQFAHLGAHVTLTTADVNGDGRQDLLVTGASLDGSLPNTLLEGGPDGGFRPIAGVPWLKTPGIRAVAWGDVDNDGRVDVYLCGAAQSALWLHGADGWRDATARAGVANAGHACADAAFADADHDGDLDILVSGADGPDQLFSNNSDGTFRQLAADSGISGPGTGGRQVLVSDLDGDRDADLVFLHDGKNTVYANDRLWRYHPAPGFGAFAGATVTQAVAGDLDADGRAELYTLDGKGGLFVWRADERGQWRPSNIYQGRFANGRDASLALADVDGDGRADLVLRNSAGVVVLRIDDDGRASEGFVSRGGVAAALLLNRNPAHGPALVGVMAGGGAPQLALWPPGPGRFEFTRVRLSGKSSRADSIRSNASGIGVHVAARNDSHWTLTDTWDHNSAAGQSLQPLALGLGGHGAIDFVALDWPDGVLQTETGLSPGSDNRISEIQRQLSSCPILFAWDGDGYRFVTDMLGVGGLGFFVAPGQYAPPRPHEAVLLPRGLPQSRDGAYRLKVLEPMEEVTYLDAARLRAVDLPPGWSTVPDERMSVNGPPPTGRPIFFRRSLDPARAVNDRGQDVTAAVLSADGVAAPPGPVDPRFIGHLARPHRLTLTFDQPINPDGVRPVLVADGWLEYPYSQTVFAAWQAGITYDAPSLEARGRDGNWHMVYRRFGYPAGMPRTMALPLKGLPAGTTALRLTTNMQVYWDRLRVVDEEVPPAGLRQQVLSPAAAELAKTGFPRRHTGPQRRPWYDYGVRSPFWDTRYMAGYYTRPGPVTPLVGATDGAFAILGPGEEVE